MATTADKTLDAGRSSPHLAHPARPSRARTAITAAEPIRDVFDLDGFKQFNDTFGHPAGDALLSRLGARLAKTMEGIGSAYRIGGDEFCVVAPVADGTARAIAGLAASALSDDRTGYAIRCSYGVALMPSHATGPDQALRLADRRMYERKRAGRRTDQLDPGLVATLDDARRESASAPISSPKSRSAMSP